MSDPNRVPLTVRLRPDDKTLFVEAAEKCGLEPGIAARQVLELMVKRLRDDDDFLEALLDMRSALRDRQAAA